MTNKTLSHATEQVPVADLKPHPRNYRTHPEEQLDHIIKSLEATGFYRNVVIAQDGTILAGHGVVQAATKMGLESVPAIRLPLDPDDPRAIKVMVGDNEIGHLGEVDDRMLLGLLDEMKGLEDLLGTGYDDNMVQSLEYVTAPPDAVTFDADEAWSDAGLPEYDPGTKKAKAIISFESIEARTEFVEKLGVQASTRYGNVLTFAWPLVDQKADWSAIKFENPDDKED